MRETSRGFLRRVLFVGAMFLVACTDARPKNPPISRSSLALTGPVTVHGLVRDNLDNPVGAATVAFVAPTDAGAKQTTTDSSGNYSLDNIDPATTYSVVVTPPSSSALLPQTIVGESFLQATNTFDVVLVPVGGAYAVSGQVTDSSGAPLANVNVTLSGTTSGLGSASASTDSTGHYSVHVLPGDYNVGFYASFSSSTLTVVVVNPDAGGDAGRGSRVTNSYSTINLYGYPLSVAGTTTFNFSLPTRSLTGQVVDVDGHPVAGASVSLPMDWSMSLGGSGVDGGPGSIYGWLSGNATADADGRFHFTVVPGTGNVVASAPDRPSVSYPITLVDDADITIKFSASVTVTGQVTDSSGAPLANVNVTLSGTTSGLGSASASTDSTGHYSVHVLPGDYNVGFYASFSSSTLTVVVVNPDAGGDAGRGSRVTNSYSTINLYGYPLSVAGTTTFNFSLPTRSLTGQVVDVDGHPVAGASVSLPMDWSMSLGGSGVDGGPGSIYGWLSGNATADADGRFHFTVVPGTGSMQVTPTAASGLMPFTITGYDLVDDTSLVIAVQFAAQSVTATLPANGTLTTDTTGNGATPSDPVATIVETPVAGLVIIDESPITQDPPSGYVFLTQQVNITAPDATDSSNPLVLTFLLDGSRLNPGEGADDVQMFRDGVPVPDCSLAGDAPPCVSERGMAGDDVRFVVLTNHASAWNFGVKLSDTPDSGVFGAGGVGGQETGGISGGPVGAGAGGWVGSNGGLGGAPTSGMGSGGTISASAGTGGSGGSAGPGGMTASTGGSGPSGQGGSIGLADASVDGGSIDGALSDSATAVAADASGEVGATVLADAGADDLRSTAIDASAAVDGGQIAASDSGSQISFDAVTTTQQQAGVDASTAPAAGSGCSCHIGSHDENASHGWLVALLAFGMIWGRGRWKKHRR